MKSTQIQCALDGKITPEMKQASFTENIDEELVLERILNGSLVIMKRKYKSQTSIGAGATTKVNVNIGTSSACVDIDAEIEKALVAEKYGADTITDLSMGGEIKTIRRHIFNNTSVPITTVPIYETIIEHGLENLETDHLLKMIEQHVNEGISSLVLHLVDKKSLEHLKSSGRIMGMVSKGGSFTSSFMIKENCENPFIEYFDEILDILRRKDVVLSLGNSMRGGCVHDRFDSSQGMEIERNIHFAEKAKSYGVQTIIEGLGGHINASDISPHIKYYKSKTKFPLFVAGPLPTDISPGYDHIAGAVGASIASGAGADYMCYITPAEHLSLPTPTQVREGLVAFKIAAHIGDSIKYGLSDKDYELSKRRSVFDWNGQMQYAIDPEKPKEMCPKEGPCSMCGEYCAIQIMGEYLSKN